MYFFKNHGKQVLDLTGNLIISHNDELIKTRSLSQGSYLVKGEYIYATNVKNLTFRKKLGLWFHVGWFIFLSKSKALSMNNNNVVKNTPVKNPEKHKFDNYDE